MTESRHKIVKTIIYTLCAIAAVVWFVAYFMRFTSFINCPAEYRDNAFTGIINAMCEGVNPYTFDYVADKVAPGVLLDSGFIHILPAVLVCKLFGTAPLQTLYITNMIYSLIAAYLMYVIVKNATQKGTLGVMSATLSLMYVLRFGMLIARPDVMALLCQIIIIAQMIQAERHDKKNVNLLIIALMAVLIVYSKPHYAMIVLAYVIYLLVGKRDIKSVGILAILGLAWTVVLTVVVWLICPAHITIWIERLYEMFAGVGTNITDSTLSGRLIDKWIQIAKQFLPFGVLIVARGIQRIVHKERYNTLSRLEQFMIIDLVLNALFLCYTGRHVGAGLWYFYFTLLPAINILSMIAIDKMGGDKKTGIVLMMLACLWICYRAVRLVPNTDEMSRWKNNALAVESLENYRSDVMYLSPVLVGCSEPNYVFDYGDQVYVPQKESVLYNILPLLMNNVAVNEAFNEYYEYVIDTIDECGYSVVVTDSVDNAITGEAKEQFENVLNEKYYVADQRDYYTETVNVKLDYWVPKE